MADAEMKYVTELNTGFMVRKTVNKTPHQRFFGIKRFGGRDEALKEALTYRDELLGEIGSIKTRHQDHINNITGIVGIAWWCGHANKGSDTIQHMIRARFVDDDGQVRSAAYAVRKYGLWHAYALAAEWRMYGTKQANEIDYEFVLERFLGFFEHVKDFVADSDESSVVSEVEDSLIMLLVEHQNTPAAVINAMPAHLLEEFGLKPKKGNFKLLAGWKASEFTKSTANRRKKLAELIRDTEQKTASGM